MKESRVELAKNMLILSQLYSTPPPPQPKRTIKDKHLNAQAHYKNNLDEDNIRIVMWGSQSTLSISIETKILSSRYVPPLKSTPIKCMISILQHNQEYCKN